MPMTALLNVRTIFEARLEYGCALRNFLEKGPQEEIIEWLSSFYQSAEPISELDLNAAKKILIKDRINTAKHYETLIKKIDTVQESNGDFQYVIDELDLQCRGYIFTNTELPYQKAALRDTTGLSSAQKTKKGLKKKSVSDQLIQNYSECPYAEEALDLLRPWLTPMQRSFVKNHELVFSGLSQEGIQKLRWTPKKANYNLSIEASFFITFISNSIKLYNRVREHATLLEAIKSIIDLNQAIQLQRDYQSLDPTLNLWQRHRKIKEWSILCEELQQRFIKCERLVSEYLVEEKEGATQHTESTIHNRQKTPDRPVSAAAESSRDMLPPKNIPKKLSENTQITEESSVDFHTERSRKIQEYKAQINLERSQRTLERKTLSENIQKEKSGAVAQCITQEQILTLAFQRLNLLSNGNLRLIEAIFDDTRIHLIRFEQIEALIGSKEGQLKGSISCPGRGGSHRKILIEPLCSVEHDRSSIGFFDTYTVSPNSSEPPAITFIHRPHGGPHTHRLPRFSVYSIRALLERIGLSAALVNQFHEARTKIPIMADPLEAPEISVATLVSFVLKSHQNIPARLQPS